MKCITHINDEHVYIAENLDIIMPMFNLIEYSNNYSDASGSLWQFKRDESLVTNDGNPDNVSTNNSTTFKYKSSFIIKSTASKGTKATCMEIGNAMKKCSRLKDMPNFNVLQNFEPI